MGKVKEQLLSAVELGIECPVVVQRSELDKVLLARKKLADLATSYSLIEAELRAYAAPYYTKGEGQFLPTTDRLVAGAFEQLDALIVMAATRQP